jgi:protocatechuate 3,4-dioxygenase beta subunit
MRLALILFVLNQAQIFSQTPGVQSPGAQSVEKARIEGQVITLTGEPVKKAAVRLQGNSTARNAGGGPTMPTAYTAQSDAAGNFVFEDVEPGRYTLSADRGGFVRGVYGLRASTNTAPMLTLIAGQKMSGLSIKLTPEGSISGKITDEDGDAVGRAQVVIYQSRYENGRRYLAMAGSAVNSTATDGTFQFSGLTAGRYYLNANDLQGFVLTGPPDTPGTKGPDMSYVATFYPNGTDSSRAVGIDVTPGNEVRGIDIQLQKARIFRVHGRLDSNAPSTNMALQLVPQDSPDAWILNSSRTMSQVQPDGTFVFEHVLSGTYLIRSQGFRSNSESGSSTLLFSRQLLTVSNANVDNVEVRLIPAGEISGKIVMEGREPAAQSGTSLARTTIGLAPVQIGFAGNIGTQSNGDGTFLIKNVPPDIYRVNVNALPSGTYVKSIRFGGADVTKSALDTTSGASGQLEVLLSPEAADLSGIVHNAQGDVVAGVPVSLWEPDTPNTLPDALVNRSATTDQNGHFQIGNLAPGEYRVAAWEQTNPNIQDPQFRAKFDSQAATVKLTASSHATNDAPLISQEAIELEAAKLR